MLARSTLRDLADDGCNLIKSGGISLTTLSPDGNWLEKKTLTPTDNQGQKINPVPSSYAAPVPLETKVTIEDYLSHDIRAVYEASSETDFSALMAELKAGAIYQFPYSFRGGLEPDSGFLLMSAEGIVFFAVGSPTRLDFVGLEQSAPAAAPEEPAADEADDLDFSMM